MKVTDLKKQFNGMEKTNQEITPKVYTRDDSP